MSAENVRRHILADRFQGKIPEAEVDAYLAGASAVNTSQYFTVPGASEPLQVRTSGYAKFADSEIPEGVLKGAKVDITGILTTYSGQYQLTLNDDSAESVRIAY